MKKRIITRIIAATTCLAMMLPMCAFVNIDLGINVKDKNGKLSVYKEISVDEKDLSGMKLTRDEFVKNIKKENYINMNFELVDRYDGGAHLIGGQYGVEVEKKKDLGNLLGACANYDADYFYAVKNSIGSKTITVKIKPSTSQGKQFIAEFSGFGKEGDNYDYNLVINTPGKILKTDGVVSADGKSVSFDIKDAIENKETVYLTVKYSDPVSYLIIPVVLIIIAGIVFAIRMIKNKKVDEADNELTPFVAPKPIKDSDDLFGTVLEAEGETTRKCPECGYPLKDEDTFCVNCGKFFE